MSRRRTVFCAALALATPAGAATLTLSSSADLVVQDSGLTLREALASIAAGADVNADATAARTGTYGVADTVLFGTTATLPHFIVTPLPLVRGPVLIDGGDRPEPIRLDGLSGAADLVGVVLSPGSELRNVHVARFGGGGVQVVPLLFGDGLENGTPPAVTPDATAILLDVEVLDSGGTGVLVGDALNASIADTRIAGSGGTGLRVRGGLVADGVTVEDGLADAVVVDSDRRVTFVDSSVSVNAGAGFRLLRASVPDTLDPDSGILIRGGVRVETTAVVGNGGDGFVVGHAVEQTGTLVARIGSCQVEQNAVGIRVAERDAALAPTFSQVTDNNVFDNRDGGILLTTSHQIADFFNGVDAYDVVPFTGNDVHHNAVESAGCTGPQTASQVVVDGPVVPSALQAAACNAPAIDTESECERLADPEDVLTGGVSHACAWTGAYCVPAWDLAGPRGGGDCTSGDNRFFAYVNQVIAPEFTQKGLAAVNGAIVSARRNTWGVGGPDNGVFADMDSEVDFQDSCSTISTCP